MELATSAFADDGIIPSEFAFCAMDAVAHVKLSANRNPDFRWSGVPMAMRAKDPWLPW